MFNVLFYVWKTISDTIYDIRYMNNINFLINHIIKKMIIIVFIFKKTITVFNQSSTCKFL